MNVKEFKQKIEKDRSVLRFSDKSYGGIPWKDWYKLANMTNKINYGCNFWSNGSCIRSRNAKENGSILNEMHCCSDCASHVGYLRFIQDDPKVISRIASYFKPKVGFWRKGKGCILPRKYRSTTCLEYRCDTTNKSFISNHASILISFFGLVSSGFIERKKLCNLGKALADINI